MAAARIQRWALSLGGYQYKLQYVPGKQLLTADALSRLPVEATGPTLDGDPPERTLQGEGKSPAELLLGYQLRSRLDTCLPPRATGSATGTDDWAISPGSRVYVRNYGTGPKWAPGHVQSTSGARMVKVETPAGVVRRNVDQVRHRREGTTGGNGYDAIASEQLDGLLDTTGTASSTHVTSTDPAAPEHRAVDVETTAAEQPPTGHIDEPTRPTQQVPDVDATAETTDPAQTPLRRSTRTRKPIDRF
ncbi:uncharacterized protein LOC125941608 isoform X1 [Dermacentor silvarum]|uniref:uncharacterized protein LOC125941608 isoform X1 n=1 Tax=Dermacentor silvarum TaxID=543639 RepID=UPI002101CB1A|nr:uncharacterized protein LOC125941608 isoform X1 [Dermacentor silvarum]